MGIVRKDTPRPKSRGFSPSQPEDYLKAAMFHIEAALGEAEKREMLTLRDRRWLESVRKRIISIIEERPSTTGGNK